MSFLSLNKRYALLALALLTSAACGTPQAALGEGDDTGGQALSRGGTYTLTNSKSHLAVAVEDGQTPSVLQSAPNGGANQQWTAQPGPGNAVLLINKATGQALMPTGGGTADGTPMVQQAPSGAAEQQFELQRQGEQGPYLVRHVRSGRCLDVSFGSMRAGAFLQLWQCADSSEMQFRLDAAAPAAPQPDSAAPGAKAPAAPQAQPQAGAVTLAELQADITTVLQLRSPIYSNRNLGNPANVALWTPDKLKSLLRGIQAAQPFFQNLTPRQLERLVVAEGAQESTGNFALPGYSVGFLQVTPATVVLDFQNHGTPIKAPDGSVVVAPGGAIDLTDPGQNVALWAWYTHNAVVAGISLNEVALGHQQGGVTRDVGNATFDWLAGPHNDRHNPAVAASYKDYHDRIKDYFVQSKFGSEAEFEALLNTPLGDTLLNVRSK